MSYPLRMGQVRVIISCQKTQKLAVFEEKTGYQKQLWQPNLQTIIGVKVDHRQTDRQANKQIL